MTCKPRYVLFIFFYAFSMNLFGQAYKGKLLDRWNDPSLVSSTAYDNAYNEIWGYATSQNEYAIIGTTKGTHFIDVTDPENIFEAHVIEGEAQGVAIVHRDFHDHQDHLYIVCDEGQSSTLQILDLSVLPNEPTMVYNSSELLNRAHNIFIDSQSDRLYSLSHKSNTTSRAYAVFDISDPANPVQIHSANTFGPLLVGHVHDAYIFDHIGYFNCGNDGLIIADMSDLSSIEVLSYLESSDYPQSGYNHSGWPSEDGNYYFFADETHGMDLKVLDVSDKTDASIIGTFDANNPSNKSIAHNQVLKEDYLYVAYYYDGLQVYDVSDPENIQRTMYYPTSQITATNDFEGAWGVYPFLPSGIILVSDMQEGLFVIDQIGVSATSDFQIEQISIFPNPTSNQLKIELNKKKAKSLKIRDTRGQVLKVENDFNRYSDHLIIDLNFDPGFYFLQIQFEDTSYSNLKFVVE